MVHDVNYLIATGNHILMDKADDYAVRRADLSVQGLLMNAGLRLRKLLHLKEGENKDKQLKYIQLGFKLRDKILNSRDYRTSLQRYRITESDFI